MRFNRLIVHNPDFDDLDIDLSKFQINTQKLTPGLRETTVLRDKWGDYHILQKVDGQVQAIQLDHKELFAILGRIAELERRH